MYEAMADRNNLRRRVFFERPDYIPMVFHINPACWNSYSAGALEELMADHPFLFPGFDPAAGPVVPAYEPNQVSGRPFVDDWGCT